MVSSILAAIFIIFLTRNRGATITLCGLDVSLINFWLITKARKGARRFSLVDLNGD